MARFEEETSGDGGRVLTVTGEVDLSVVDQLVDRARACLAEGAGLQLDLRAVSFIDSSGLGALVLLRNEATAAGQGFSLVAVPASMSRLLQLTGLQNAFDVRVERA